MLPACELASLSPVHEDGIPDSPPEEYRRRRHWVLPLRMLLAGLLITVLTGGAVATAGLLQLKDLENELQDLRHHAPSSRRTRSRRRRPASRRRSCSSGPTTGTPTARTTRGRTRSCSCGSTRRRARSRCSRSRATWRSRSPAAAGEDQRVVQPRRARPHGAHGQGPAEHDRERFHINHAVATTFGGFVEAVNEIGCVYIDVDRRYYHSNAGLPVSAALLGDRRPRRLPEAVRNAARWSSSASAISTTTSCARRASRTSCARPRTSCATAGVLDHLRPLARIFARATETDGDLQTSKGILRLAKIARRLERQAGPADPLPGDVRARRRGHPGRPADRDDRPRLYVTATPEQIRAAVKEFMHPGPAKKISPSRRPSATAARAPARAAT